MWVAEDIQVAGVESGGSRRESRLRFPKTEMQRAIDGGFLDGPIRERASPPGFPFQMLPLFCAFFGRSRLQRSGRPP
eukprot:5770110-Lingulodinium_polyedra.AAC.1